MEKKDKPRLAEVLGVDVGERFKAKDFQGDIVGPLSVNAEGFMTWVDDDGGLSDEVVYIAINHPESIIRTQRLTEAELERCRVFGVKYLTRNGGKAIVHMWDKMPGVLEDDEGKCYIIGRSGARDLGGVDSVFFPSVEPDGCICAEGGLHGNETEN